MRIRYRNIDFRPETQERIVQINAILSEYRGRVSVRQLYYRLVAGGFIPNNDKEYGHVQDLVTKARYAGLIDWDAIEDRNREPTKPRDWQDGGSALADVAPVFRLNRWQGQSFYVELWVEKAALAGVLAPISSDYHVTLMVNRGYSSASAMKESAERIIWRSHIEYDESGFSKTPQPVILYIGDHDPSGNDMDRDIRERLIEFGCPSSLDVRKLALTIDQVHEFDPPPNPAKMTDVRAKAYVEKFGEFSWEVDALPPPVLDRITRKALNSYIDKKLMDTVISRENTIKAKIRSLAATFKE